MKKQRDFAGNIPVILAMIFFALTLALLLGMGCAVQQAGLATTSEASPTPLVVALAASPTPIPPTATPTQEMTFYSPIDTPTMEPTPTEEKPTPTPTATLPILTGFSAERIQVAKISPIPVMVEGEEKKTQVVGWSPDGRKVALDVNTGVMYGAINPFTGHKTSQFAYDLWLANADGSAMERIVPDGARLKWSSDGSLIAFTTSRSIDGIYSHELGYMRSDGTDKKILLTGTGYILDWLDSDTIAFLQDDRIQLIDIDGEEVRPFTVNDIGDRKIRRFFFSPDRKKIAFGTAIPGEVRLWIADIEGERAYPIAHFDMFDSPVFIAWSPDSARLAYKSYDFWPLTIVHADGTTPIEVEVWAPGTNITWSPDGKVIALSGFEPRADGIREYPATPPGILVVNADGTDLRRITPPEEEAWYPFWSPDGRFIGYTQGPPELFREHRSAVLSLELR